MKQTGLNFKLSKINGHPVDVKAVMDTWTLQMNYPVITLTRLDNGHLRVTQKRFLSNPQAQDPLKYTSQFGSVHLTVWVKENNTCIQNDVYIQVCTHIDTVMYIYKQAY